MASKPLQLQWDLQQTADSTLSVARGIVRAATSDNVQVLALLACERFGATLAMCSQTCKKVEDLIIKAQPPAVIGYLSAVVGYSSNDCASQLVHSLAGLQFLGLAASLVTSIGPYEGANALEAMLRSSAANRTLLPTARQLKVLLASLEPRCVQLGFADTVAGWQIFLSAAFQQYGDFWKVSTFYPSSDGLEKLVDAFRQLGRIGDATSITLKATACTPWVVAFTKWCLGVPPSIYLEDGTPILEQPDSKVTVTASNDSEYCPGLEIMVHRSVGTPAELVNATFGSESWSGMLSIECYGQWLLRNYDLAAGCGHRAITQALPYALSQVVALLQLSRYGEFDASVPIWEWQKRQQSDEGKQIDRDLLRLATNPFAKDDNISSSLSRILGSTQPSQLHSLGDGLLIADLPIVDLHLQNLKQHCKRSRCDSSAAPSFRTCGMDMFFHDLAFLVADILSLSLFDCSDTLLVKLNHHRSGSDPFKAAIYGILTTGFPNKVACGISKVLQWALTLVGHDVSDSVQRQKWVISCYKGQAVYPKLFETSRIEKRGYLTLSWAPGLLRYDGEVFPRGVGSMSSTTGEDPVTLRYNDAVTIPRNLAPEHRLVWRVTRGDDLLEINLGLEHPSKNISHICMPPFAILANLVDIGGMPP